MHLRARSSSRKTVGRSRLAARRRGSHTYHRMNVITEQPAGDYQPGQWG